MQKLLVTALLCAASTGSIAQATYSLSFSGGGTHFKDAWECPNQVCAESTEHVDFFGTLNITTSTPLDGVFTGSSLLAFQLNSNLFSLTDSFPGPNGPFSVTVGNGVVVSIDGTQTNAPFSQTVVFEDMTIDYSQGPLHHYGPTFASATIVAVPEPGTWALLGLALPFVFYRMRRSGR
jgi:hypothetical protein